MQPKNIAIVGAGLSGLTTAVYLLQKGFRVTIFEASPYLGGQATSWTDADGDDVETVHMEFPWYYNFNRLFENIGIELPLLSMNGDFHILDGHSGEVNHLETDPFSLSKSLMGMAKYRALSFRDKMQVGSFIFKILKTSMDACEKYDDLTVDEFLRRQNIRPRVKKFLELVPVTIQGLYSQQASAASFLKFMKVMYGSIGDEQGSFFTKPTSEALFKPLGDYIRNHGGVINLSTRVAELAIEDYLGRPEVIQIHTDRRTYHRDFDEVVIAMPAYLIPRLLPRQFRNEKPFSGFTQLSSAHVTCLQLWYDEQVFPDGNVYVSNRERVLFDTVIDKKYHWHDWENVARWGSVLQVLIDASEDVDIPEDPDDENLLKLTLDDLARFFWNGEVVQPKKWTVIRHEHLKNNIYSGTRPGYWQNILRGHETPIRNLLIGGESTSPPYNYGMESAVRAGTEVAQCIFDKHDGSSVEIIELPFDNLVKCLETKKTQFN